MACAKFLNVMKVNRTLLCERESLIADVADLVPICTLSCQGNIGHVVGGRGRNLQQEAHEACDQAKEVVPAQQPKCNIATTVVQEMAGGQSLDEAQSEVGSTCTLLLVVI